MKLVFAFDHVCTSGFRPIAITFHSASVTLYTPCAQSIFPNVPEEREALYDMLRSTIYAIILQDLNTHSSHNIRDYTHTASVTMLIMLLFEVNKLFSQNSHSTIYGVKRVERSNALDTVLYKNLHLKNYFPRFKNECPRIEFLIKTEGC